MRSPSRVFLGLSLAVLVSWAITHSPLSYAGPDEQAANPSPLAAEAYAYDARVAWINAGELSLQVTRDRQEYEFTGSFKTSREMSAYYTWNGIFAGVGRWGRFGPTSDAYLARTVSKDTDLKIVVMSRDGVRRLDGVGGDFESVTKPAGNDLISALFFSPQCQSDGLVHDGEDEYSLTLRSQQSRDMDDGDDYYEGTVTDCEYLVTDRRERKRKVIVSLAEIDGQMMAVRVRAKIPIWPDPIFRLKTPRPANGPKVASVDQPGARQID